MLIKAERLTVEQAGNSRGSRTERSARLIIARSAESASGRSQHGVGRDVCRPGTRRSAVRFVLFCAFSKGPPVYYVSRINETPFVRARGQVRARKEGGGGRQRGSTVVKNGGYDSDLDPPFVSAIPRGRCGLRAFRGYGGKFRLECDDAGENGAAAAARRGEEGARVRVKRVARPHAGETRPRRKRRSLAARFKARHGCVFKAQ